MAAPGGGLVQDARPEEKLSPLVPAKAGTKIFANRPRIPAFAGMSGRNFASPAGDRSRICALSEPDGCYRMRSGAALLRGHALMNVEIEYCGM